MKYGNDAESRCAGWNLFPSEDACATDVQRLHFGLRRKEKTPGINPGAFMRIGLTAATECGTPQIIQCRKRFLTPFLLIEPVCGEVGQVEHVDAAVAGEVPVLERTPFADIGGGAVTG